MKCSRCSSWPIVLIAAAAIGFLAYRSLTSGVAPTPPAFDESATLEVALNRAESSGKPVLAFATADWCGPCQSFKRGPLTDAGVSDLISQATEPAYIDLTDSDDADAAEAARVLSIRSIPALILIEDGREIARLEGGTSAAALEDWLDDAVNR